MTIPTRQWRAAVRTAPTGPHRDLHVRKPEIVWIAIAVLAALVLVSSEAKAEWPTLGELVDRVRARAPAVVDAAGALRSAHAVGVGARLSSWGNPYLEVIADRGKFTTDVQVLGQLFVPVDVHGQRSARIEEADRLLEWKGMSKVEVQARMMGEAVSAYGESVVAVAQGAEAQRLEDEARKEADWFGAKAAARDATVLDVSLAEAEVVRYVQMRAEARLRLIASRSRLVVLTGLEGIGEPSADRGLEPPVLRSQRQTANRDRVPASVPLLRSLGSEASFWTAARERWDAEKNQPFYLMLYGGRGDFAEMRYGGGFGYTFPMTRLNQGEVARAEAERARALQLRSAMEQAVKVRLQSSTDAIATIREAIAQIDSAGLPAATNAVKAAHDSFREGKTELVRVLIVRRDLAALRMRRLDLVASAWRSYAEIVAILGELP